MVGIHAMLQLVINRSNPQFTFERAEHRLDLCQLHIAGPKHRRVAVGQIRPQQIVSIAPLGLLALVPVHPKRKGLAAAQIELQIGSCI